MAQTPNNQQNNLDLRQTLLNFFKQNTNISIDISSLSVPDPDEYLKSLDPNSRVVYKLNSDKTDYIVAITPSGDVQYFYKGIYGDYVSKSSPLPNSSFSLYLITVEKEKIVQKYLSEIISTKYDDLTELVIYRIKYKIIEVKADVITKEHYTVVKKITPAGKEYYAEAFTLDIGIGTRKDGIDEAKAEIIKAKYAALLKLPFYVSIEQGRKAKWDAFYLRLKIVTKTPELVKPASQIIDTDTSLELDLFEDQNNQTNTDQNTTEQSQQTSQQIQLEQQTTDKNQQTVDLDVTLAQPIEKPRGGYVELYLLDFNLPSKYIAKLSTKAEKLDDKTYKIETLVNSYLARKVENIRRVAYEQVGRYFANTTIGWIAVNEKGVQIAKELNENIRRALKEIAEKKQITIRKQTYEIPEELTNRIQEITNKYYVKAIRILLNYEDAKYIIENVINQLREGIEELQEKIEKAKQENKRALAKVYEYNLKYQQLLLESFEEFYAKKFNLVG
jgi:DNA-binding Lrp family transcriptional regulator